MTWRPGWQPCCSCHIDVPEHLQLPALAPARIVQLVDPSSRHRSGVVDQNVHAAALAGQGLDVDQLGQVAGMYFGQDGKLLSDTFRLVLQLVFAARREMDVTSFFRQLPGDGQADAPGCPRHQGRFPRQVKIHRSSLAAL